ncbi:MAG: lipocalin family protein [Bacteroidota bacterium]
MKTIKRTLLFLGLTLFTFSCSKDESENEPSIVGKWNYSKIDNTDDGVENFVDYVQDDSSCSKDNYNFVANGNFEDTSFITDTSPCEVYASVGTWVKNGTGLKLSLDGDGVYNFEILKLTETELKLKLDSSFSIILVR